MLLNGMKIVSFCHFLQGPAAMQYLADMGAALVKIEPPQGAFERDWSGADRAKVGGVSALYLCANRDARSLALDLKHPEAKDVVFRLLEHSHVLAENYRPGAMERLGLGYEAVRARKPDIIYASASGYGAAGPYSGRPGQDLVIQAMSGLAWSSGPAGSPVPAGSAVTDQHGAALLALGIVGAYARWLSTGAGTRVESTLLGAGVDLQTEALVTYFAAGSHADVERDPRLATWFHEAPYGVYRIADGHVALSLNPPARLADALGSEALRAFVGCNAYAERDAIAAAVAAELQGRPFVELAAAFDAAGVWYARVDDYDAVVRNPQIAHNETFRDVEINGAHVKVLRHPVRYDGRTPGDGRYALAAGADTREVLGEAGFSDAEIAELLRDRIAFAAD